MDKITLEQVKYQCRIEHNDEDELLNGYILSAYDYVQNHTGRNLYNDNIPDDDKNGIIITPSINHACLMLVAHWYANRETVANNMVNAAEMPFSVGIEMIFQIRFAEMPTESRQFKGIISELTTDADDTKKKLRKKGKIVMTSDSTKTLTL